MRMRRLSAVVGAAAVSLAVVASGSTEAKRAIKPKAGGYVGKVTNANGKGRVELIVATFVATPGAKPRKGPQLLTWRGVLKCKDGSSSEVGPSVFAPLKGARFSGRAKSGSQTTTLRGRFTSNTRMKGTVRVVTKGDAPPAQCATGPVTFKAHRR
jgi:hypothetical protein